MATAHREAGFQFRVLSRDHNPPHVHAVKGDGVVVLILGERVSVDRFVGLNPAEVRRAVKIAAANYDLLMGKWKELHEK